MSVLKSQLFPSLLPLGLDKTWSLDTSVGDISSLISGLHFQVKKVVYLSSITEQ